MAGRLAKNVTEEFLTCPVCLERFKEPRTLPGCEHSFCLACLAGHIDRTLSDDTFRCPVDRAEIKLTNDVKDPWVIAASYDVNPTLDGFLRVVHNDIRRNSDAPSFYCFACQTLTTAEAAVEGHKGDDCECIKLSKAYTRVLPSLVGYRQDLEKMLRETDRLRWQKNGTTGLSESQQEVLQQIELYESKLETFYMDTKEKVSLLKGEVLEYVVEQDVGEVEDDMEAVRDQIKDAYIDLNDAIDDENMGCLLMSFSDMKPKITKLRKRLNSTLGKSSRNCSFEFVPDPKLQELFHNQLNFGTLHSIEHFNFSGQPNPSEASRVNFYDVAVNGKYIIITDGENGIIRRFLIDGSYVDSMSITNPCRITFTAESEIAVTRFFKKKITTITLGRKMHVKDHMKTKRSYVGICFLSHDKFAATFYSDDERSGIDIISKKGEIQHSLLSNTSGAGNDPLFLVPMFLTKTSNGNIVFCDFSDTRHVMCVSDALSPLWCRQVESTPCGVTCDADTVYVSLPDANHVIALDQKDGEKLRNIVKPTDGVKRPYATSACGGELVITEDESDKIHIFRV
ncbi:uncharacterized protein LOC110447424 [Mizuhopecten yessoensis]|uniref:RING finger protein nhl-1 n=1 Tax=Mizuhopecten yessoensis TaxID=6573 RepID=A0A210QVE1_MIZYE|nr:uncharacterized protein LOC110447424 [Mizuhopecten yessoensis]OWF52701.1 RING finger protein nhl-1 [Mizuhopecten yessoensis]